MNVNALGKAIENGKSQEVKQLQIAELKKRVKEQPRKLEILFNVLGPRSPYYIFCVSMNAMMFAVFNHFNEMDSFLVLSDNDQVYTDDKGRIVAPEYPSVIDEDGNYATSNGAMDLTTLTILNNISSMAGCIVALLIARWSYHKSIVTFSVLIVTSYLLSQSFLFNFFDRVTFVIGSIFSKTLSIVTIQAAFESGQGKYRVLALGFSYYLNNFFVFVTMLLFKKDKFYAETYYIFIISGLTALYTLMCPSHMIHSIVRRDLKRIARILEKFGTSKIESKDIAAVVDDVIFVTRVPRTPIESIGYLVRIKPFLKKMLVLIVMVAIQSRLNAGDMEMYKTILPYSPIECILISRIVACCASFIAVYGIIRFGRRPFILFILFMNLFFSYIISLIPLDTIYNCFSTDMPGEEYNLEIKISFIFLSGIRVSLTIITFLLTLEHIPTMHRSFVFPLVMLVDSVVTSSADASPYWITDIHDNPQFIRPMIRYSIVALLLAAIFIDNTDVVVFHPDEIPCYNLENCDKKKKKILRDDFEEQFRVLCELKAVEKDAYEVQETEQNVGYEMESTVYNKNKTSKIDMKIKIRDSSTDPKIREQLRIHYLRRMKKDKRCIEDLRKKTTNLDDESQEIVQSIQKNRLKG